MTHHRNEEHPLCRWPQALVVEARKLHAMGIGRKRIAREICVPESTVRDWLRHWTRRTANDRYPPRKRI